MENTRNNEPTLLQSLIAEELKKIKVIYCPPGSNSEMLLGIRNDVAENLSGRLQQAY